MVEVVEVSPTPSKRGKRSKRFWLAIAAVVVLVVGGAITAVSVSFRYLHAEPLSINSTGWLPPDNQHYRSVDAGPYSATIVPPRPGHDQTFELEINNFSAVSQTILGLTNAADLANARDHAETERLLISANSEWPRSGPIRYTSGPVTLAPGSTYLLHYTHHTSADWTGCKSESWEGLSLQVRVGIFTRTEDVDFGGLILELKYLHCE